VTVTEEARLRLRATRKAAPQRPAWHPPALTDFAPHVRVLAFDASLVNVGWVVLIVTDRVIVEAHGTIRPEARDDGYMGTWQRASHLRKRLWEENLVLRYMRDPGTEKAVEAPIVGSGHRTESSLIAGMTVWMESDPCAVISPTHVSAVLLGDPKIKSAERKPAIKAAVCRYVPEAAGRDWNEHCRDGLSVGLTRLHDLKEAP
jgi:hypothetical protein